MMTELLATSMRRLLNRVTKPVAVPIEDIPRPLDRQRYSRVKAKGYVDPRHRKGVKRITITVDDALFDRIGEHAKAGHVSFAEASRILIERGLLQ
jgi:hypothetical protein